MLYFCIDKRIQAIFRIVMSICEKKDESLCMNLCCFRFVRVVLKGFNRRCSWHNLVCACRLNRAKVHSHNTHSHIMAFRLVQVRLWKGVLAGTRPSASPAGDGLQENGMACATLEDRFVNKRLKNRPHS